MMKKINNSCRVQGCPCAHPCNRVEINAELMQHGREFRFTRGQMIWRMDEPANFLMTTCTGALKLSRPWSGEREILLEIAHRGQMIGETAGIPGGRRAENCAALADGRGMLLDREALKRILADRPELTTNLLTVAVERSQVLATRLEEIARGSVESRLAHVLQRLGHEIGITDARGRMLPLRLSRGDLADMVGCRVESATRVLAGWERDGVLETLREGIVLLKPTYLDEVSAVL